MTAVLRSDQPCATLACYGAESAWVDSSDEPLPSLTGSPWNVDSFVASAFSDSSGIVGTITDITIIGITSNVLVISSAIGTLTAIAAFTGSAVATSNAVGTLTTIAQFTGSAVATSNAVGTLTAIAAFTGSALATSSAVGALTAVAAFTGSALATSSAVGTPIISFIENLTSTAFIIGIATAIPTVQHTYSLISASFAQAYNTAQLAPQNGIKFITQNGWIVRLTSQGGHLGWQYIRNPAINTQEGPLPALMSRDALIELALAILAAAT